MSNGYYAVVYRDRSKYSADVYKPNGELFMRKFLYDFNRKHVLVRELAALSVEIVKSSPAPRA
jgi:hypothetical protein